MRRGATWVLCAVADGSLPPARRLALLMRIGASPALIHALHQQVIAVEAVRRFDCPAPAWLRIRIEQAIRDACGSSR